ncbi:MAG: formylglycine-generating enzyme family protein [Spirochaetaceae bacterium]|jgi:formylglycine-generating enzyme required for sulfatase activity|nr:formylglycine-generating enzyme family protein [Spirochaetaceae bacterium]
MKYTVTLAVMLAVMSPVLEAQTNALVRIQGGTFMMGSPSSEAHRQDDEYQHQVTVGTFYMGKYEVTQKEYAAVAGQNPSYYKGENLPVECVSWYDAVEYCNLRSQQEGLTLAYTIRKTEKDPNNTSPYDSVKWLVTWDPNANGYRLPTEAEWEYACRGGSAGLFYTGNSPESAAWYWDNSAEHSHPVGQKEPNSFGLYDMHGNVWEWCWDWYGSYASDSPRNPSGPSSGSNRVERGGSWGDYSSGLRSASRLDFNPSSRNGRLGFRLVRSSL